MKTKMTLALTAATFSMRTIVFASLLLLTPRLVFAAASVAIDSATVNYSANQVTVTGSDFKPGNTAPTVQLGTATLIVITSSDTQIVADLPANLAAGTFSLTVTNSQNSSKGFDVTYGATGPAAASWFGAEPETGADAIPWSGNGYVTLYTMTLPHAGTYMLGGEQMFFNNNPTITASFYCAWGDPNYAPGLPTLWTKNLSPGEWATVPISGYYVAKTAGVTLSLQCAWEPNGGPPPASATGMQAWLGMLTALLVPDVTTESRVVNDRAIVLPVGSRLAKVPTP